MCTFHTFEKNALKDLRPPEKSGLQYKCLMLILKIVYQCIVSNETSLKQFSLEIKISSPFFGDNSFYRTANSQFFWDEKVLYVTEHICIQWNSGHVLIEKVLFD